MKYINRFILKNILDIMEWVYLIVYNVFFLIFNYLVNWIDNNKNILCIRCLKSLSELLFDSLNYIQNNESIYNIIEIKQYSILLYIN